MRLLIITVCIACIALPSAARGEKYAAEFMALGGGARAMGMGGAFIAIANDPTTTYWNPAGLARFSSMLGTPKDWAFSLMHSERFGDIVDYNFATAVSPLKGGKSGWGITLIHLGVSDIPVIPFSEGMIGNSDGDEIYEPHLGEVLNFDPRYIPMESANDFAVFLSYAQAMGIGSVGGSVKFIRNDQITGVTSFGIGIDIGYLKDRVFKDLAVGVKLQDATGTYISWSTGKKEFIYPALKIGLAYPIDIKSMKSTLILAVDGDFRFENRKWASQYWIGRASSDFHFGAELIIRELVALRGGNDMGRWTAGAGFLLQNFGWNTTIGLDYALLIHDVFDTTHRISIQIAH